MLGADGISRYFLNMGNIKKIDNQAMFFYKNNNLKYLLEKLTDKYLLLAGGWEQYTEDYCFIQNFYYVPENDEIPDDESARNDQLSYYRVCETIHSYNMPIAVGADCVSCSSIHVLLTKLSMEHDQ
jgi:hypothetical protein